MNTRILIITLLAILTPTFAWALGEPSWVKTLPKAGNDTYYYRMTKAEGVDYEQAYTKAFSMAILESQWKIGVLVQKSEDEKSVEQALKQELNLKEQNMKISINKVCEYEQVSSNPKGGVVLYCLWQVSCYGNVKADFEDFLDCQ